MRISSADLIDAADAQAGEATATFTPNSVDDAEVGVAITFANGAHAFVAMDAETPQSEHSWRLRIGAAAEGPDASPRCSGSLTASLASRHGKPPTLAHSTAQTAGRANHVVSHDTGEDQESVQALRSAPNFRLSRCRVIPIPRSSGGELVSHWNRSSVPPPKRASAISIRSSGLTGHSDDHTTLSEGVDSSTTGETSPASSRNHLARWSVSASNTTGFGATRRWTLSART